MQTYKADTGKKRLFDGNRTLARPTPYPRPARVTVPQPRSHPIDAAHAGEARGPKPGSRAVCPRAVFVFFWACARARALAPPLRPTPTGTRLTCARRLTSKSGSMVGGSKTVPKSHGADRKKKGSERVSKRKKFVLSADPPKHASTPHTLPPQQVLRCPGSSRSPCLLGGACFPFLLSAARLQAPRRVHHVLPPCALHARSALRAWDEYLSKFEG